MERAGKTTYSIGVDYALLELRYGRQRQIAAEVARDESLTACRRLVLAFRLQQYATPQANVAPKIAEELEAYLPSGVQDEHRRCLSCPQHNDGNAIRAGRTH